MTAIKVKKYNLPDSYLFENNVDTPLVKVWIPEETCIVLGRSNNQLDSLFIEKVIEDNIPVYKRPSGGETVLLSNKMLVLSISVRQTALKSGKSYFEKYNTKVISVLKNLGIDELGFKGISDIAINNMKILGSAVYQNKDIVFYHAVINVSESISLISKYLKHPMREPDYRIGRDHKEFVTSLDQEKYDVNMLDLKEKYRKRISDSQIMFHLHKLYY